jgi:hypothetical protein
MAGMAQKRALAPSPASAPPNMIAVNGRVLGPANGGPQPVAAGAVPPLQPGLNPQTSNLLAALPVRKHPMLPSGLNAVSSAAAPDRMLAVDPAGAVFLSHDAGRHWEAVPRQWTGKVIEVHAQPRAPYSFNSATGSDKAGSVVPVPPPPENSSGAGPAVAAPGAPGPATLSVNVKPAPLSPAMLFELVNDRHRTWLSLDGKVWHEQPQSSPPD